MKIVTGSETASLERECSRLNISGSVLLAPGDFAAEREALRTSDIALNPRTECPGIPQKLLNYMAAACPIVSFEGSARHLTNGRSAIIVPDGDVEAFARAVLTLLDDPDLAKTLGENARNVVEDDLSWERTAKLVIDVYRKFGQTP
jgi:glycosyltransferase involved in cell wall biosynthesis